MGVPVSPAITTLLSIFGVIVGEFLQNHFAKQNNQAKQLLESRNQAYVDFLEAVSLVVAAQRMGKKDQEAEQLARSDFLSFHSRSCLPTIRFSNPIFFFWVFFKSTAGKGIAGIPWHT